MNYALIGKNLRHSFSKKYFETKFSSLGLHDYLYNLIDMPSLDMLHETITSLALDGFNVTIPYKKEIVPMLDAIDPVAAEIGAVNTVKVEHSNRLHGFNTDAPAFLHTLHPILTTHISPSPHKALILGTGGAAQAVAWALRKLGIGYNFVSRNPQQHLNAISYNDALSKTHEITIIINTTPLGMFPNCEVSPWPDAKLISQQHLCYDLVYNPSPTLFLKQAGRQGATIKDGLEMLHLQADLSFRLWKPFSAS